MTKTIVANAIALVGAQATTLLVSIVAVYTCHVLFGLTAEIGADVVGAAQAACAGFMARSWFC